MASVQCTPLHADAGGWDGEQGMGLKGTLENDT